ncbi:MAG TPA: hypothetical protein VN328_01145 [Thermodesulfovibrionales bacterium]|nr:hypothetical protein [Thermodesulfovibrionales bacterium]
MLIGYNTNIPHKGKQYHVQTEDSGLAHPFIVTHLYHEGAILRSIKTNYSHIVGHPDFETELRNLMKRQHRTMIKALITGSTEKKQGTTGENPLPQPPEDVAIKPDPDNNQGPGKGLDDVLLEHIKKQVES